MTVQVKQLGLDINQTYDRLREGLDARSKEITQKLLQAKTNFQHHYPWRDKELKDKELRQIEEMLRSSEIIYNDDAREIEKTRYRALFGKLSCIDNQDLAQLDIKLHHVQEKLIDTREMLTLDDIPIDRQCQTRVLTISLNVSLSKYALEPKEYYSDGLLDTLELLGPEAVPFTDQLRDFDFSKTGNGNKENGSGADDEVNLFGHRGSRVSLGRHEDRSSTTLWLNYVWGWWTW